jgi:hypothetical protein
MQQEKIIEKDINTGSVGCLRWTHQRDICHRYMLNGNETALIEESGMTWFCNILTKSRIVVMLV